VQTGILHIPYKLECYIKEVWSNLGDIYRTLSWLSVIVKAGKRERLSTVDLQIMVACYVENVNNIFNIKKELM
jgi:hypothetical protein